MKLKDYSKIWREGGVQEAYATRNDPAIQQQLAIAAAHGDENG